MTSLLVLLTWLLTAWLMPPPPDPAPEPPPCTNCDAPVATVDSVGPALQAAVKRAASDFVPRGDPATHGDAPGRRQWKTIEERLVAACVGNGLGNAQVLCNAAVDTCAGDDQVRYWIWQRETTHTRDDAGVVASGEPGPWLRLPSSYCLGPDDPGVPTIGRVIAQVQVDFRNLPLPVAGIQAAPTPTSLVNVPTAFFAGGARTTTFSPTILGTTVTINAKASSWHWTWGDDKQEVTDSPGVPKRAVVSHLYSKAGSYRVGVTTTWTGTFTLPGSTEVFTIRTPATVVSPPVTVQVREARTQLVAQ